MGYRARVRATGHAAPTMEAHARYNSSHDQTEWRHIVAEREAEVAARGIRFEREVDDDDMEEAA